MPKISEINQEHIAQNYQFEDMRDSCLDAFIKKIGDEITGSCMIPMMLPKTAVNNIINVAKSWFKEFYEDMMIEKYYVIPSAVFNDPIFKQTRTLTLDFERQSGGGEIYSVFGCFRTNNRSGYLGFNRFDSADKDFSLHRHITAGFYNSSDASVAGGANSLQDYVIHQMFYEMAHNIMENPLSFHYNRLVHSLKFMGEDPKTDVVIHCYETIPDCALFQNHSFFRYCVAQCLISMGSKLGIFEYNLPGNININFDNLQTLGENMLDQVKEEILAQNSADYFFTT